MSNPITHELRDIQHLIGLVDGEASGSPNINYNPDITPSTPGYHSEKLVINPPTPDGFTVIHGENAHIHNVSFNIGHSKMENANFRGASLIGVTFDTVRNISEDAETVGIMNRCVFDNAILRSHCIFSPTILVASRHVKTVVKNSSFKYTQFQHTCFNNTFIDCDFHFAQFQNCTLLNVTFLNCNLSSASFQNCDEVGMIYFNNCKIDHMEVISRFKFPPSGNSTTTRPIGLSSSMIAWCRRISGIPEFDFTHNNGRYIPQDLTREEQRLYNRLEYIDTTYNEMPFTNTSTQPQGPNRVFEQEELSMTPRSDTSFDDDDDDNYDDEEEEEEEEEEWQALPSPQSPTRSVPIFDPVTGEVHGNPQYVPSEETTPIGDSSYEITANDTYNDIILGDDVNLIESLKDVDNTGMIFFHVESTPPDAWIGITKEQLITVANNDSYIKYACTQEWSTEVARQGITLDDIVKPNVPYLSIASFGALFRGVILLKHLHTILNDTENRVYELIDNPSTPNLVTTISYGAYITADTYVSRAHCQTGQGDTVYDVNYIRLPDGSLPPSTIYPSTPLNTAQRTPVASARSPITEYMLRTNERPPPYERLSPIRRMPSLESPASPAIVTQQLNNPGTFNSPSRHRRVNPTVRSRSPTRSPSRSPTRSDTVRRRLFGPSPTSGGRNIKRSTPTKSCRRPSVRRQELKNKQRTRRQNHKNSKSMKKVTRRRK